MILNGYLDEFITLDLYPHYREATRLKATFFFINVYP